MPSLEQLREMLRSGEFYDGPKPESKDETPSNPSHHSGSAEPQPEPAETSPKGERDRMCRLSALGKPDSRAGGKRFKKVYIIDMIKVAGTGEVEGSNPTWEVWATWGRAGNALNEKRLLATTIKAKAVKLYRAKIAEKLDREYNIENRTGDE